MSNLRIAIFGASGATGLLLTERCLAAGYSLKSLVRRPDLFRFKDRVEVVQGDAKDPAAVQRTVAGADVVLSALGARSLGKEEVLEIAVPHIVAAMEADGVRRIIVLGAAGAVDSALDKQPTWRRWITGKIVFKTILKWPMSSQRAQYAALSASSLDWTMVMPPMLTNGPGKGTYRIDGDALPRDGSRIARQDVADFMMQQIDDPTWVRKGVYLSW